MLKDQKQPASNYAAIHRALLTGLLGNIGTKTDTGEFLGTRNGKFAVFPGSTLFKRKPAWLMSAEIVETTKLYARTNAKIDPEWIERLAEHLVQRTYTEPRWQAASGNVVADEKVSLYGLTIIPKRLVHYGPIDAKVSRALFIHHALVEGDYRTTAPFFQHNLKLLDEVRSLEAKSRSRHYLVDIEARFDFYDKRLPPDVFGGHSFEKWRRQAEHREPRILFMQPRDLLKREADDITLEAFPDHLLVAGSKLMLDYHLDPGDPLDGVTVTIPLAALNQLPEEPFEWLVPGLLKEKILELIRSLPKGTRVNFVPAPDFAEKALPLIPFGKGNVYDAVALALGKTTGLQVNPNEFDLSQLPPFLRMNYRIVDQAGKPLALGRDLSQLRQKLGLAARATFETLPPHPEFHRDNLKRWDFGDLPARIEMKRAGVTLGAYPGLVDKTDSVSLRLFDTADQAQVSHRAGVRRLFMIELGPELRHLWRNIPHFDRMAMNYKLLGSTDELRAQVVAAAADRAFAADGHIRSQPEFTRRALGAWRSLSDEHRRLADIADLTLVQYYAMVKDLGKPFAPLLMPSVDDMRSHLGRLINKSFILQTPNDWLPHLPRFLKGIGIRLTRLTNAGLSRDQQAMQQIAPLDKALRERQTQHHKSGIIDAALIHYRWMLEEFRISLFAQELKTSIPISTKRLADQWQLVRA